MSAISLTNANKPWLVGSLSQTHETADRPQSDPRLLYSKTADLLLNLPGNYGRVKHRARKRAGENYDRLVV
jgi:hypothetical protein